MKFSQELIPGTLIKRYKRFLADICLEDGSICFISGCGYQTRCQTFTGFNPAKIRRKSCCHFFLIQRMDGNRFAPAEKIDPHYGEMLREAFAHGVEILPYRARVSPQEIKIDRRLEFDL